MDMFEAQVQVEVEKRIREIVENPDNIIAAYRRKVEILETAIEQYAPKIEFYDTVTKSDDWSDMAEVAKLVSLEGWGRNNIFSLLRQREVLRYNNEPYQRYVERGYFKLVEQHYVNPKSGETMISKKTVVSQRGLDFIIKLLKDVE